MVFREEAGKMPMKNIKSENVVQTNQLTKIIDGKELVKDVDIHAALTLKKEEK